MISSTISCNRFAASCRSEGSTTSTPCTTPLHRQLTGVNRNGKPIGLTVEKTDPQPDLSNYAMDVKYSGLTQGDGTLFGTGTLPIHVLRHTPQELQTSDDRILRVRAEQLWR